MSHLSLVSVFLVFLFQGAAAKAEINIQRSSDGGKTWNQFGHDTASLGFKAVNASGAECEDSVIGKTTSSSSLLQQRRVPFANPGSNATQQTFMRFINPNNTLTEVEVYGIDDDGTPIPLVQTTNTYTAEVPFCELGVGGAVGCCWAGSASEIG